MINYINSFLIQPKNIAIQHKYIKYNGFAEIHNKYLITNAIFHPIFKDEFNMIKQHTNYSNIHSYQKETTLEKDELK